MAPWRKRAVAIIGVASMTWLIFPFGSRSAFIKETHWLGADTPTGVSLYRNSLASHENLYHTNVSDKDIRFALGDKDSRVSKEFKVTADMRPLVEFWLRIYTQYSSHQLVLYDRDHPEIVYETLDFRAISEKYPNNRMAYEILRNRAVDRAFKRYRQAFRGLLANPDPTHPTPEQRSILRARKRTHHPIRIADMSRNMRGQTGQRDNVIRGIVAADPFFPTMEEIFEHQKVPPELTRLSLVESSFNLKAVSRANAVGVWQFLNASGREYMLIRPESRIDERRSPLKSTVAAARLLKRNRGILGNWPMAITSYHYGVGNLQRIPSKLRLSSNATKLFSSCASNRPALIGYAGRNYFAEFLAILHAEKYRDLFFGTNPENHRELIYFYRVDTRLSLTQFAEQNGLSLHMLHLLNPDVGNTTALLPRGFWIAVPEDFEVPSAYGLKQWVQQRRGA